MEHDRVYQGYVDAAPQRSVRVFGFDEHGDMVEEGYLAHHIRHSPDGFSWGYSGSGPSELARCLLIDATERDSADPVIEHYYRRFRDDVVARWPQGRGFMIYRSAILHWLEAARETDWDREHGTD